MNIKTTVGASLLAIGLVSGGAYYFTKAPSKPALYQEDEFVSVTTFYNEPVNVTDKEPHASGQKVALNDEPSQATAPQVQEVTEPDLDAVMLTDGSSVDAPDGVEVLSVSEPIIELRDPSEATERGLTVTVYPRPTNNWLSAEPIFSEKKAGQIERQKLRDDFTYGDVPVGRFIAGRDFLKTDEFGYYPYNHMAPLNSKQVLTGFIDIPEDGFYFIYPLGNHLHERSQGHWRDSSIYPNTLRDSVLTAEGSSITIDVGKETLFNYTYPETDFNLSKGGRVHKSPPVRVIQRVELKKGKYPIKAVFSRVYLDGRGGGERFEGVNIMLHKSENARDVENLGFVYSNKRQARLTTFPLSDDTNQNALASNPRDVKYTDFQFDIKEETPLDKFSQQQGSFSLKHFKFTLKPEVAGPYYIGQDISTSAPRYKGTIFYDRNKNVNENRTGNFQCYINGTYEGEFGKKTFRDEGVWLKQGQEEALGRVGRGFNLYTTLLSGGSKLYLNVTPDMAGKDIDIEIKYYCNFSTFHDPYYFDSSFRNYIFTPLLKTPSNNSYKPLEYFAE